MKSLVLAAGLALAAAPALAQEVNVYSTRQPDLIDPLFERFTEETGIAVNVVFIDKGLIERLRAEGDRTPADLVLTVDIANLSAVVEAGVTQPVESAVIDANIPAEFRDTDNQWFGLTARSRVVYASKERVEAGAITTYEDLADPKWQGKLCTRSGMHNYNIALISAYIAHHGAEAAEEWVKGLKANLARKPQGNDRAQAKAIWSGECDIALGNTYYMGLMLNDPEEAQWADAVNVVYPVFEGGGAHMNVSGVAMTAAAPNRDNALKLMEFLTTEEAQHLYAELNYEFPLKEGVPFSETVAAWGEFEPDSIPLTEVASHRAEALRIVERTGYDE
ncbi:Fe(3+) ABC transporter substrate-binding protein [Paroceanicella profunda]|uniref:Fe(3+) ABC transporter substrate-binding protein n=1 Tax=Paroceanicella profunda TaxID=2579971 RepID=A0A5B8FQM0_9RHOB|nr:Fe(3+) ABC transporter substrate-binding protein [Paroceanicella profunda]QDL90685.1 Fe(3+) ABC transporter substrate-binding protein [Paroceanicella profunda]